MKPQQPHAIDWDDIRRRLARAAAATEAVLHPSPERARQILEERARELARPLSQAAPAAALLEVVTFTLAGERYAVEARHVWEVVRFTEFTPLPGAPEFWVGVINLRGEILGVIDLRKFFGLPQRGLTDLTRVLVLGSGRPEFGLLADAAHEVTQLHTDAIHAPAAEGTGLGRDYVRGVTADLVIILNSDLLLRDPRLFIGAAEAVAS